MNITFGKLDLDYLWIGFKIIYGGLDSVQGPQHSQGFWLVIYPIWWLLIGDLSILKDSDWSSYYSQGLWLAPDEMCEVKGNEQEISPRVWHLAARHDS